MENGPIEQHPSLQINHLLQINIFLRTFIVPTDQTTHDIRHIRKRNDLMKNALQGITFLLLFFLRAFFFRILHLSSQLPIRSLLPIAQLAIAQTSPHPQNRSPLTTAR